MRSLALVAALLGIPGAVAEAQSIAPMRPSVLFTPAAPLSLSDTTSSGHNDRVPATVFGAILGLVMSGAFVYEADTGPSDSKLPIVIGGTVAGGLIGYLIGTLLSSD